MSKQMTPCEKLGYKVGDEFEVVAHHAFKKGQVVTLHIDDGSECPLFSGSGGMTRGIDGVEASYASLHKEVKPVITKKLKPAKQALADAIHQNAGWLIAGDYNFVTSNHRGVVKFFHEKPRRDGVNWVGGSCSLAWVDLHQQLPNWHQCILSRDEYFTAYPEQVKVEVNNETEHKVESEMKSESEMTIKIGGDWHKNGELPPVGEVCEILGAFGHYQKWFECKIIAEHNGSVFAANERSWINVRKGEREFRPLRTERDKAIDEMKLVCQHHGSWENVGRIYAEAIYDAGYRKEVK